MLDFYSCKFINQFLSVGRIGFLKLRIYEHKKGNDHEAKWIAFKPQILNLEQENLIFLPENLISYESKNRVIYIYSDNIIFGIDLNMVEFIGFDVDKVRNKIKSKSLKFLEGDEILVEYNNYLERLNFDIKLIPFLFSLNSND